MTVRCRVICDDGPTPPEYEFPLMPRVGSVFVFPGQYAVYEVSDILRNGLSPDGAVIGDSVAIVVKRKAAREIRAPIQTASRPTSSTSR